MTDIHWLLHRLKSMNIQEVVWRGQQKLLQKREYKKFYQRHLPVTEIPLEKGLDDLKADASGIPYNKDNKNYTLFTTLDLFASFDYQEYKNKWNAGFQTDNNWPQQEFSYHIRIGQREDIGDIRTNWELNRHYQFACLAKNYYITGDAQYLHELTKLFEDWNSRNLFLHGVQWTSAMELGIRSLSWIYTYVFLTYASERYHADIHKLIEQIRHGLLCMADYIVRHRARYSSANNHLIIEIFAVGMVGILFHQSEWIHLSVKILTEELPRQNYEDGVNKEMSLHYQSFVMEAYGILWLALKKNNIRVPESWKTYLSAMSRYLADCCGDYGEVIVFGDNDEGKLLDLQGKMKNYYQYVLELMGMVLEDRYTDAALSENISWLVDDDTLQKYQNKKLYTSNLIAHYKKGGYTILRSQDHKVLIGFDHAPLGFGTIAAHGHADALSIQVFYEGTPVLTDSGTYNYHVPKKARDEFRSAKAHNTVYVEGIEQAQMLGPFLWGKRYKVVKCRMEQNDTDVRLEAEIHYGNICHVREIIFDYEKSLTVKDRVSGCIKMKQCWNMPLEEQCRKMTDRYQAKHFILMTTADAEEEKHRKSSDQYNEIHESECYFFQTNSAQLCSKFIFK